MVAVENGWLAFQIDSMVTHATKEPKDDNLQKG
jgi:hypothetical protein